MSGSLAVLAGAVSAALVSMAVYAATGARRDADAQKRGTRFLLGAGDFVVHWFLWAISPLDRLSLRVGLGPDAYNLGGLLFGLASGAAAASGRLEMAGWAIALGGVCDIMDGRMARARGLSSAYGTFIDSTLDRFVEVFAFLGFVAYLRDFPHGPLVASAAITGSLLVSYTRARGESQGVLCKEGLMQRAERLVLTFLACVLDPPLAAALGWPPGTVLFWTLAVIAGGTFLTAAHRTLWIAARLRER
ncbi:MAG TPA: CDP-alcohol phosphatidyltransferase family protein [Vicinamibacteria bacterium]|nr:CDP-alcohol phosphatidyltransferase family protein [Vicinamibacteria bacterium]